jgi:hypothetical protein
MEPGSTPQDDSDPLTGSEHFPGSAQSHQEHTHRPALDFGFREGALTETTAREALDYAGEKMSAFWANPAIVHIETEADSDFDWREHLYLEHEELRLSLNALESHFGKTGPTAFMMSARALPDGMVRYYDKVALAVFAVLKSEQPIERLTTLSDGLSRVQRHSKPDDVIAYIKNFEILASKLHESRFETLSAAQNAIMERTHHTKLSLFRDVASFIVAERAPQTERTAFRVLRNAIQNDWCPAACFSHAIHRKPQTPETLAYVASQLTKSTPLFPNEKVPLTLKHENQVDFLLSKADLELLREQSSEVVRDSKKLSHALHLLADAKDSVPEKQGARDALLQRTSYYASMGISPALAIKEFVADVKLAAKVEKSDQAVELLLYPKGRTHTELEVAKSILTNDYGSDQHPVATSDRATYAHYFGQTAQVFRGIIDEYRGGFVADKYTAQHHKPGEHSHLAAMSIDLAEHVHYVYADTHMSFPGRGVLVDGMDPARFLSTLPNAEDPFTEHKEANPWLASAIDTMPLCTQVHLRGCKIVLPPAFTDHSIFTINIGEGRREPYAYIVFNDHFQNVGNHKAFLVPAVILRAKLTETSTPTDLWEEGIRTAPRDINHQDLTPLGLLEAAKRYGAPILNLGTPSVYCGSLANAFPRGSAPYWRWEGTAKDEKVWSQFRDLHGHKHKSFITGHYIEDMSDNIDGERQQELWEEVLEGHKDIFETVQNYQAIRSLYRIAEENWKKGLTLEREVDEDAEDQDWDLGIQWKEGDSLDQPNIQSESETGPNIDPIDAMMGDDTPSPRLHPNSFRMLDKALEIHEYLVAKGKTDPEDFPLLVPVQTLRYTTPTSGEFELDTYDMTLYLADGRQIDMSADAVREQVELAWAQHVMPLFENQLVGLRFLEKGEEN